MRPSPTTKLAPSLPSQKFKSNSLRSPSAVIRSSETVATSPAGPMASAKETYRAELRSAARQLGERCLYSAAKWYALRTPQPLNP
jgi:hypothetical protein